MSRGRWFRLGFLAVLIIAALVVGNRASQRTAATAVAPVVAASPSAVQSPSPGPSVSRTPTGPARAALTPQQTAERFVVAWLDTRPTVTNAKRAWLDRMRPVTYPPFLDALSTTDLTNVPKGKMLGGATLVNGGQTGAVLTVRTSFATLVISEIADDDTGRWLVSSIDENR